MKKCNRNDRILCFSIDHKKILTKFFHEKDETSADTHVQSLVGSSVIFNNDGVLNSIGFEITVMKDELFSQVDNKSLFYSSCIFEDYYSVSKVKPKKRSQRDHLIYAIFPVYIGKLIDYFYELHMHDDSHQYIHWVLTVPDQWDNNLVNSVKQCFIHTKASCIDNIVIVPHSIALINYLQLPHYGYTFTEGGYQIVCYLREYNEVAVYGYEIGAPVRGMNNVISSTLKYQRTFFVDYVKDEMWIDLLFDGSRKKLKKYNVNLKNLTQLCYREYTSDLGDNPSMYDILIRHKDTFLKDIERTFFIHKEAKLKSITLDDIANASRLTSSDFEDVTRCIINLARENYMAKIITVSEAYMCVDKDIPSFFENIPTELAIYNHPYNTCRHHSFTIGAARILQSRLNLKAKLPKVINKNNLKSVSNGNLLYFDIACDTTSVVFIDSKKQKHLIENSSEISNLCYTINDCFDVKNNPYRFNEYHIKMADRFIQMLQIEEDLSIQSGQGTEKESSTSTKKKKKAKVKNHDSIKSLKLQLRSVVDYFCPDISVFHFFKESIFREDHPFMLSFFIEILQVYIKHYLISNGMVTRKESLNCYFSVNQAVLDCFHVSHDNLRNSFEDKEDTISPPIRLIHSEQVTAVYCKEQLKCYERVIDSLDYPQYIVQAHLYESYIDLTLNAVLAIKKNVQSTNEETVLTLKRKRISFDMVNIMAEKLWEHIMSTDDICISTCSQHKMTENEDGTDMYTVFVKCFKKYFTEKYTAQCSEGFMDWYKPANIPMSDSCSCTYSLSPIDLFDICIDPVIYHLTSIISSSTANPSLFGDYLIKDIFIMGQPMKLKCSNTNIEIFNRFKNNVERQNKYNEQLSIHWAKKPISFVIAEGIMSIVRNPLGGLLEQVTSGEYLISFTENASSFCNEWRTFNKGTSIFYFQAYERITEENRDNGFFGVFYFDEDEVHAGLSFKPLNEENSYIPMKLLEFSNVSSYPLTARLVFRINQVILSYHVKEEGLLELNYQNTCSFPFTEDTVLSLFA
ncbi:hypothetical protein BDB01DRAFT_810268 [Pilobolus umbonatus]|nr:hypothetical protein BDB01DRAFT_810268 [Pilobolus umbonatus]